jgi:hypothetical protein
MANPRIEVEIGAKVDDLASGINQVTGQLGKLENAVNQATPEINKLKKATNEYNAVGTNFNRLIQDAPFGIIGISNNITSLAESFGDARNKGKSFTQILGGIFSSGNLLGLGISALTSAFVVLQQKGFFKTEESAKSLSDRLNEYQESLKGVAAATLKGSQDAQKEIASLKGLELQVTNTSISQEKRLQAVDQLQKQYPEYFGNLTKEQILNGQVGDAYIKVTQNLLAKAKAQASINQIAQNSIELLRIETKLEDERSKRLLATSDAQGQLDLLIAKRQKDGFLTQGDIDRYNELIRRINNANDSLGEEKTLQGEIKRIKSENVKLEGEINKQLQAGANLVNDRTKGVDKEKEAFERFSKAWDDFNLANLNNNVFSNTLIDIQKINSLLAGDFGKSLKDVSIDLSGFTPTDIVPEIDESKLTAFVLRLQEFNNQVAGVLESGIEQTLGNFAFAIGDALASGGNVLKAGGAVLLEGLAGILNQLGQMAIETGITIGAIKAALKTLNPAVAIGAGIALIALAGFVSSKARSLSGSRGGGGGSSVGTSGVGGGTSFTGGGQGFNFNPNNVVVLETVVRGQDILFVSQQASNRVNKG